MPELISVGSLTEMAIKQKLQENRRELKRRVEFLRMFLWTVLEVLESNFPMVPPTMLADHTQEIDGLASQICIAEQILEQLKDPRTRARVRAINERKFQIQREKLDGSRMGVPA